MDIFSKKELVTELEGLLKLAKKMPNEMYFHASIEFSGVDKKFMQLAQQYNIDKAQKAKKSMEAIKNKEGNV